MGAKLVRVPADRCKGGHIPFRLDVDQIQAQNLQNYRQLSVSHSNAAQRVSVPRRSGICCTHG